jgi:ribosome-associated translation inhibitor RaiA
VHITVIGASGTADSRTRAYVQHRVSDGFRSLEREIRAVDVSLFHQSHDASWGVSCTVTVEFTNGHRVVVTTAAEWPYAAIDKAVEEASRDSVPVRRESVRS